MKRASKIHLDATQAGGDFRKARCGWVAVDVESDITKVTCKACLRALRAESEPARPRPVGQGAMGAAAFQSVLAEALRTDLAPSAGPPPLLTAPLWSASCKGTVDQRRCGQCELCEWEREAERWAAVAPWTEKAPPRRGPQRFAWGSLDAAIVALIDWESHDRWSPSATGMVLDRLKRGDIGNDGGRSRPEDPLLARAGDFVLVRRALESAYPEGGHTLSQAARMRLLAERTPGVLAKMPTYQELAEREGLTEGDVRALVKHGRRAATVHLAARELIPMPSSAAGLAEDIEAARAAHQRQEHP